MVLRWAWDAQTFVRNGNVSAVQVCWTWSVRWRGSGQPAQVPPRGTPRTLSCTRSAGSSLASCPDLHTSSTRSLTVWHGTASPSVRQNSFSVQPLLVAETGRCIQDAAKRRVGALVAALRGLRTIQAAIQEFDGV